MATAKAKPRSKSRTQSAAKRGRAQARRATSTSRRKPSDTPDAIAVLKEDHRELRSLFETLREARGERRAQGVAKLRALLTRHTEVEENIFYPAFRAAGQTRKDRQLFHEATEEHHAVDMVLPEVERAIDDDDVFAARLKVVCELVQHHMQEEESEMFPRSRDLLEPSELRALGAQIQTARRTTQPGPSRNPLRAVASLVGIGT